MTDRLDVELVRRGHARSRTRAAALVTTGRVTVAGHLARRPAQQVAPDTEVTVALGDEGDQWVSRAAHKLAGALAAAAALAPGELDVTGRHCLDAGASTGGFTQVLLAGGAARVVALDVGHDQLAPEIAADPRVVVREGVNVRGLDPADPDLDPAPTLIVADLSFISLTLVLPALLAAAAPGADLLVLVKPQFEVGRERLGRGGVVTSSDLRSEAVLVVARAASPAEVRAVIPSPLPGQEGNREYFLWLRCADAQPDNLVDPSSNRRSEHQDGALSGGDAGAAALRRAITTAVTLDRPSLVEERP